VQVGRDGAASPAVDTGFAVVWAHPTRACEEGCCDVVGDTNHHLMAPARQSIHTTDRTQQVSWQGSKQLAAESGQQ
jgi:hypothetical protein